VAGLLAATAGARSAGAGDLQGRVVLDLPGIQLDDVGPIVVYIEPLHGAATAAPPPPVALRQRDARFSPPFLAVARGQTVEMPNDDDIYHNVFSFSTPNGFDLGLYPAGESRSITFRESGVVRIYCSIHESMNGTIFVAPTPWFTVADSEGHFAIRGVPAGRVRVRTWAEKLPASERGVSLGDGANHLDLPLATPAGRQAVSRSRHQRSSASPGIGRANR
jgi:plastocyanin